jgi:hypothetical protein
VEIPRPVVRWVPRSAKYTIRPMIVAEPEIFPPSWYRQSILPERASIA